MTRPIPPKSLEHMRAIQQQAQEKLQEALNLTAAALDLPPGCSFDLGTGEITMPDPPAEEAEHRNGKSRIDPKELREGVKLP